MAVWTIYNFVEEGGRNPIRKWLVRLPAEDQATIDYRLQQMAAMPRWPDKWVSKYQGYDGIFELRIAGNKVAYRPLFAYFGQMGFVILNGAIEKGDKIRKSDLETARERLAKIQRDSKNHVCFHEFDDEGDLEEDAE